GDDTVIVDALSTLAERHPRYGFLKLCTLQQKPGQEWNHKRVWRVYSVHKLSDAIPIFDSSKRFGRDY
ncbi:MAG: putative transposase, partial [Gammaproteobacteria bacterium]